MTTATGHACWFILNASMDRVRRLEGFCGRIYMQLFIICILQVFLCIGLNSFIWSLFLPKPTTKERKINNTNKSNRINSLTVGIASPSAIKLMKKADAKFQCL